MNWIQPLLAVAGVFGLLALAVAAFGRKGARGLRFRPRGACPPGMELQGVDRLALTATHSLHLVRFGKRALLIAAHPAGCVLLESGDWVEERERGTGAAA